jgi:hypothetical protein
MDALPWDNILVKDDQPVWLKVREKHTHNWWWGKLPDSRPVVMLEVTGDYVPEIRLARRRLSGLNADLMELSSVVGRGLVVSLQSAADSDIFYRLCLSVMESCDQVENERQAVASCLNHIERWQEFLSVSRQRKLSREEVRGLFAELSVLSLLVDQYERDPATVLNSWLGPLRYPQDFVFDDIAVEVKSIGGVLGESVSISSAEQLEVGGVPLCLMVIALAEVNDHGEGSSLNVQVRRIERKLGPQLEELFSARLRSAGYVKSEDYDTPVFASSQPEYYEVRPGFPSVTRAELPSAVTKIRYELDIPALSEFAVEDLYELGQQ